MRKQEQNLQIAVSTFLKSQYPNVIFTSESSGIRVGIGAAVKMKKQRSNHALPDMIILQPSKQFHGLMLELKAEGTTIFKKDGTLVADKHIREQHETLRLLQNAGYCAKFCVGVDDAIETINNYFKS